MHRTYSNDDITVFWDSEKCYHSKRCVTGCPEVFNIQRKPWIDISQAPNAKIWQAIEKCPSGALSVTFNHDVEIRFIEEEKRAAAFLGETEIGECCYREEEGAWAIVHTEVDPEHGGKGIAKRLVYCVTEAAERKKLGVIPICSYAVAVLK